jgi:hypothetical protein
MLKKSSEKRLESSDLQCSTAINVDLRICIIELVLWAFDGRVIWREWGNEGKGAWGKLGKKERRGTKPIDSKRKRDHDVIHLEFHPMNRSTLVIRPIIGRGAIG